MATKKKEKKPPKTPKNAAKSGKTAEKKASNPVNKKEKISAAEFARRMDLDKSRITRGIEQGIISNSVKRDGGKWAITWPDGRDEWNDNVQEEHRPDPMRAGAAREQGKADASNPEAKRFQLARSIKEEYAANKMRVEYGQLIGELIPVEDVRREALRTAKRTRDSMMAIPVKLAAQIAAIEDAHEVEQLLTDAIIDALKDLKNVFSA